MAIYFPENPRDKQQYPEKGDTGGLKDTNGIIYVFNLSSNSWNIVGPDNVATTDWVLNQKKDDTTALDKGYDLIAATNDITIEVELSSAVSDSGSNNLLESSMRAHVVTDSKSFESGLEEYLPEWEENQIASGNPGGGAFVVAGIDRDQLVVDLDDTTNCFRTEYKHTVDLLFSESDKTSQRIDWIANSGVGDVIEVNFLGSVGNADYAIYRVLSNRQVDVNNVALRVEFMGSSNPDQSWRSTSSTTYYEFKVFKKAFSADGGDIEGKLHVYYDDVDTFLVGPDDRNEDPVLVVDTVNNTVVANDEYTFNMTSYIGVMPANSFVTLGHLNHRLGDPDTNKPDKLGPFMPTRGGQFLGNKELIFKRYVGATTGGEGGFRIKGEVGGGSTSDILLIKFDDADGDTILYKGNECDDPNEILNRLSIETLLDENLDEYLPLDGSKQMKGMLKLYPADPVDPTHAATKSYVDSKPLIIPNVTSGNPPTEPGALYSKNGYLYWVKP